MYSFIKSSLLRVPHKVVVTKIASRKGIKIVRRNIQMEIIENPDNDDDFAKAALVAIITYGDSFYKQSTSIMCLK